MISISSLLELLGFVLTCAGILVAFTRKFTSLESKHEHLRNEFDAAYDLFCKKNSEFEQQLEEQSKTSNSNIQTVISQFNALSISIAEVKTEVRLMREQKSNNVERCS